MCEKALQLLFADGVLFYLPTLMLHELKGTASIRHYQTRVSDWSKLHWVNDKRRKHACVATPACENFEHVSLKCAYTCV